MSDCVHYLDRAVAIQRESDPAKRLAMLQGLSETEVGPVLEWLWADAQRTFSTRNRPNEKDGPKRARDLLAYIDAATAEAP